jgi:hypothetical protein
LQFLHGGSLKLGENRILLGSTRFVSQSLNLWNFPDQAGSFIPGLRIPADEAAEIRQIWVVKA